MNKREFSAAKRERNGVLQRGVNPVSRPHFLPSYGSQLSIVDVTVASGSERWSRKDTSIPTLNLSSSPQWIAASTPDTVPAIPCPLVKR